MLYIFLYIFIFFAAADALGTSLEEEHSLYKRGADERKIDGEEDEEKMRQEDDKSTRMILQPHSKLE